MDASPQIKSQRTTPASQISPADDLHCAVSQSYFELPREIKIYPTLAVRSISMKKGGALRVWTLAKALDNLGSGAIDSTTLKSSCFCAGINRTTYNRWLNEAIKNGWVTRKTRSSSVEILLIASVSRVAETLGCDHIDHHPILLDTQTLLTGNWRSKVWEAFIYVRFNGKIVSRKVLHELSGINRFEQVRLEKGTSVQNIVNIVETKLSASHISGMQEFSHPTAFEFNGHTAFRLPDKRCVTSPIKLARRGRSKKINQKLNLSRISSFPDAGLSKPDRFIRLYFNDQKELERAFRRYGRKGYGVSELFLLERSYDCGKCSQVWKAVAK